MYCEEAVPISQSLKSIYLYDFGAQTCHPLEFVSPTAVNSPVKFSTEMS